MPLIEYNRKRPWCYVVWTVCDNHYIDCLAHDCSISIANTLEILQPEQVVEQTLDLPVIWDVMTSVWRHCNDLCTAMCSTAKPGPWSILRTIFSLWLKFYGNFILLSSSHPNCSQVITMKICTWHDNCGVVARTNFCSDMMLQNGVTLQKKPRRLSKFLVLKMADGNSQISMYS